MFYDNYVKLCARIGKSPSGVAREIGLSNAAANGWKKGKNPNDTTISKLSDYFGVSADVLLSKETAPTQTGERELPHAEYREVLSEGGMRLLMDADAKIPEEHLEEIVEFIKMKQRKYGR